MSTSEKAGQLPVMLRDGARYVCNFLQFSGYFSDQEVYSCTLVTEEAPFTPLKETFALLLCSPHKLGYELIYDPEEMQMILYNLNTGNDGYAKNCDLQVLQHIVPLFRAVFPLKIHTINKTTGQAFRCTNELREDLDKSIIHNSLSKLFNAYIELIRLCNFHEDLFLAQCEAYTQLTSGAKFMRGPLHEMQQGGSLPFMDYEQASNWLELADWQPDSEYYDSLDRNQLQARIDFVKQLQTCTASLLEIGKPLLQNSLSCERLFEKFKTFSAFELVFNDEAAFMGDE